MRLHRYLVTVAIVALLASPATGGGQPASPARPGARKATTVTALVSYPVFFHTQAIRVRGMVLERNGKAYLRAGDAEVLVAGEVSADGGTPPAESELTGTFFDVGRLEPGNPRLAGVDITRFWPQTGRTWPGVGELQVLRVDATTPADPFAAPSVRSLALDPLRYVDQRVTVTGRFRGFNLYGDLPDAPVS